MKEHLSPSEIAQAIRKDIVEVKAISLTEAAAQLNKKPNNLYNILNGKSRISRNTAAQFHRIFGYSIDFITKGIGSLYSSTAEINHDGFMIDEDLTSPYFYLDNPEGLTERELALNFYARGFGLILEKALQLVPMNLNNYFPSGDLSEVTNLTDGRSFAPQSREEKRLMSSIIQSYSLLKRFVDLNRVLDALDASESAEKTHRTM